MDVNVIIADKYRVKRTLGGGTFGDVFLAEEIENERYVAIKQMDLEPEGLSSVKLREIGILKKLNHKNIISFRDVHADEKENKLYVVMEYMETDLRKLMNNYNMKARSEEEEDDVSIVKANIKGILYQILQGVEYTHSQGYFHRDLKLQNILYDKESGLVKIADFGLAREYDFDRNKYTPEVVTLNYRAPEILLGSRKYSFPVDIWSIGCLFGEMARDGVIMFPNDSQTGSSQLDRIFKTMGTPNKESELASIPEFEFYEAKQYDPMRLETLFDDDFEPAGIRLLSEMLCLDPSDRITARRALEHEYFEGFVPSP